MGKALLILEDGTKWEGLWLGGRARCAEVVFNTSHGGYEEIATDPSYYGQIMVMTAPMQGNYGVSDSFWESREYWIEGFVALDLERGDMSWLERLIERNIPVVTGLDTRALVMHLREKGVQKGVLISEEEMQKESTKVSTLFEESLDRPKDWVHAVSRQEPETIKGENSKGSRVAVMDYGCKTNILRELTARCSELKIFPSRTSAQDVLDWSPDGIMLSNGPGDPEHVETSVEVLQELLGKKVTFGICMGSQLMARALGAKNYKLKFGHRGANHPIKDLRSQEIYMTSQNHGYAVEEGSLPSHVEVIHRNLNDQTVAGLRCADKKCFSVQFHPESHPGPREAHALFDEFIEWIQNEL